MTSKICNAWNLVGNLRTVEALLLKTPENFIKKTWGVLKIILILKN